MRSACFLLALALPVLGSDWPRYLGPGGDAKVSGPALSKPGATRWEADIGRGCSGFAIDGGKAVVMGNIDNTDIVWCFDAKSGRVLWKYEYPEDLAPKYFEGGPNATPTIDGDRVYTLSRTGNLFCLSMKDGQPVWHQHYQTDFDGTAPRWGYAAAPVVSGDQLWCLPCGDAAAVYVLDKRSGEVKWRIGEGGVDPGYAAPVFFKHQGRNAMAAFHGRELVVYDLDNNARRWFAYPWRTSYDVNASNPQYHEGRMFIASGYGMGYAVIDVSGGEPELLHRDRDRRLIFQNSVLDEGDVIAVFGDRGFPAELIRMDMASGTVRWKVGLPGSRGSCLMVGDSLVALAETGDLVVGRPTKAGWNEAGRAKVLSGTCWAPVAYADGMVFARSNQGKAVAVSVR